ncbi:MAG: glycosyltransferase family 2 protein [Patescibacteria group bacterium]|nr:glycosyltransferase family 2 protein [Patescibacteria group bacterium]
MYKKLSIIIPVYNEKDTVLEILKLIDDVNLILKKEIIIVDDASTDGTVEILKGLDKNKYKIVFKNKNSGKGSSVKEGLLLATGDISVIQDADLEYDPQDYNRLLEPILNGKADVVFGSRFQGDRPHRVLYFWHYLGNKFLTFLSNIFTGFNLSDMEVCYKLFKREVLESFVHKLKSKRFGIEPELTSYVAKGGWRLYEVGVSYDGRTYSQGKKIGWKDGFSAIWAIIRFNIFK